MIWRSRWSILGGQIIQALQIAVRKLAGLHNSLQRFAPQKVSPSLLCVVGLPFQRSTQTHCNIQENCCEFMLLFGCSAIHNFVCVCAEGKCFNMQAHFCRCLHYKGTGARGLACGSLQLLEGELFALHNAPLLKFTVGEHLNYEHIWIHLILEHWFLIHRWEKHVQDPYHPPAGIPDSVI